MAPWATSFTATAVLTSGMPTAATSPMPRPLAKPMAPSSRAPTTGAATSMAAPAATPCTMCPAPRKSPSPRCRGPDSSPLKKLSRLCGSSIVASAVTSTSAAAAAPFSAAAPASAGFSTTGDAGAGAGAAPSAWSLMAVHSNSKSAWSCEAAGTGRSAAIKTAKTAAATTARSGAILCGWLDEGLALALGSIRAMLLALRRRRPGPRQPPRAAKGRTPRLADPGASAGHPGPSHAPRPPRRSGPAPP
mmetsp:Transcript_43380/g.135921  ORF Transcript_43380/g.135921 Transcript_43380/m.135921 type:complete len:247 (-) Transcript_43380:16-756(-)